MHYSVLKLSLHNHLIGYLLGYQDGRNKVVFSENYRADLSRPTLTLTTSTQFPNATNLLNKIWERKLRLPPTFSNLLPEGALRALLAQQLKIQNEQEFQLLAHLGHDLPGALVVQALKVDEIPEFLLNDSLPVDADLTLLPNVNKFSLAGVQMKFSMHEVDGRYTLSSTQKLGNWIIKTPSNQHTDVPLNEFTAMRLAQMMGVDIPEIRLVPVSQIESIPGLKLPDEPLAFAIKRFDRDNNKRIHTEDFAQVFMKYPHEKYDGGNYEQIGQTLLNYSNNGLADVQQFALRLLANILLANGDAHLKNWSLISPDQIQAQLAPAYDIVCTKAYIPNEQHAALNLAKTKSWQQLSFKHFQLWAKKIDAPWSSIQAALKNGLDKARSLWPQALIDLPMNSEHKQILQQHWAQLHEDFRI